MLQSEVRRAYADVKELRRLKDMDEKTVNSEERKLVYAKTIADKLKKENHELKLLNFSVTNKLTQVQKKYEDLRVQFRRWTESATKITAIQ
jgi:phage terminase Nu1 subunit (DNA packaging protein)